MDTDIDALEKTIAKFGSLGVEELAKTKKIITEMTKKEFIEDAEKVWDARDLNCCWDRYLARATGIMLSRTTPDRQISPEAIGVAKVMKLAVRLREFDEKNKLVNSVPGVCTAEVLKEKYDNIGDILNAFVEEKRSE